MEPTLAFVGVSTLIVMTPGPHLLIVTRSSLQGGRLAGMASALGIAAGTALWSIAAAAGLTAFVATAPGLLAIIRWLGAGYLLWLGVRALVAHPTHGSDEPPRDAGRPRGVWRAPFRIGLLSNLLHPGQVVFFVSLLPQFIDPRGDAALQVARLSVIFVAIVLAWFAVYTLLVARLRMSPRVATAFQRVSGIAFVAFAVRLVLDA